MSKKVDLVEKYNLGSAIKKIQKINEYTFYSPTMVEDDQDPNGADDFQGQNNMPQQQPMDGGNMGGGQMPMGNPQDGGQDIAADGSAPQGDEQMPMGNGGADMPPMGDDTQMTDQGGEMEDPNLGGGEDIEDVEMDTEQPGDEVVDVDELTQSQETTEFKVDDLDDKLTKVLNIISKFDDAIRSNDQQIEDLKKEFAKRNPTPEETLNLRSLASYPFSERPDEYWKKQQEEHPNYNVISNNDVSTADEQKEFEIRKGDIDNFNERDVMKSLGEEHIRLSDFLDF